MKSGRLNNIRQSCEGCGKKNQTIFIQECRAGHQIQNFFLTVNIRGKKLGQPSLVSQGGNKFPHINIFRINSPQKQDQASLIVSGYPSLQLRDQDEAEGTVIQNRDSGQQDVDIGGAALFCQIRSGFFGCQTQKPDHAFLIAFIGKGGKSGTILKTNLVRQPVKQPAKFGQRGGTQLSCGNLVSVMEGDRVQSVQPTDDSFGRLMENLQQSLFLGRRKGLIERIMLIHRLDEVTLQPMRGFS